MASNFSSLRSARKNALDSLNKAIKEESSKQGADERFWKLTVDAKTKVGYARLRFLPAPKNEEVPWVRVFRHAFKVGGAWLIDNCPTTLGQRTCPVCKENNKLWNSGIEADKNVARDRKRKQQFISNILVIDDPSHPENNGKVFLYSYGPKIHDKIQEAINPQYPDASPVNPFDMWEGADFKLKSQSVAGFQNYDKSEFADASELKGSDDDKEAIWQQEHSLAQFVAEDQFKSYDDLAKRLDKVLTGDNDAPRSAQEAIRNESPTATDATDAADSIERKAASARKPRGAKVETKPLVVKEDENGDDVPEDEDGIKNFFAGVLKD
jgi:hypothetical protein